MNRRRPAIHSAVSLKFSMLCLEKGTTMSHGSAEIVDAGIGLALVIAGACLNKNPAANGLLKAALLFAVLLFGFAVWRNA
jgi:hypothetical protein